MYYSLANLNPFTTGNPFLGGKLLGFSIGRGSGALKGLRSRFEDRKCKKKKRNGSPLSPVQLKYLQLLIRS